MQTAMMMCFSVVYLGETKMFLATANPSWEELASIIVFRQQMFGHVIEIHVT